MKVNVDECSACLDGPVPATRRWPWLPKRNLEAPVSGSVDTEEQVPAEPRGRPVAAPDPTRMQPPPPQPRPAAELLRLAQQQRWADARPHLAAFQVIVPALPGIVLHRAFLLGDAVTPELVGRILDEVILPAALHGPTA